MVSYSGPVGEGPTLDEPKIESIQENPLAEFRADDVV